MTRADAQALYDDLKDRADLVSYGKHIPGFWKPYLAGDLRAAATALRTWLEKTPSEMNRLLLEKLDTLEAAHG